MTSATISGPADIRQRRFSRRAHGQLVITPGVALYTGDYPGHSQELHGKFDERDPGNSGYLEAILDALFDSCSESITCISVSKERLQIEYTKKKADREQIEQLVEEILE
jgi:hypothetical protein